jgi:hypothetical protein
LMRMIVLGADAYNLFIRNSACEKREAKFSLFRKVFSGLNNLPYETIWELQYLFKVACL